MLSTKYTWSLNIYEHFIYLSTSFTWDLYLHDHVIYLRTSFDIILLFSIESEEEWKTTLTKIADYGIKDEEVRI